VDEACIEGDCVPRPCEADPECPFGFECVNGTCDAGVPACADGLPCGAQGFCLRGVCLALAPCLDDAGCEPGYLCALNFCVPRLECTEVTPCPFSLACEDGLCSASGPACAGDLDCLPTERCVLGQCQVVPPGVCIADDDCPAGQVCDQGACVDAVPRCNGPTDCQPGEVCDGGTCVPGPVACVDDTPCPPTQRCFFGFCAVAPPFCTVDADCPAGGVCRDDLCVAVGDLCEADADCAPGEVCVAGVCGPEPLADCASDADCADGERCANSVCNPPPVRVCANDAQCPFYQLCSGGLCADRPAQCVDPFSCGLGRVCADGICVPLVPCVGGACGAGQVCVAGLACIPSVACDVTAECPAPAVCIEGACAQQPDGCDFSSECGEGFVCNARVCVQRRLCDADDACPDGQLCEFGECGAPRPCAVDANCSAGRACIDGLCQSPQAAAVCDGATPIEGPGVLLGDLALGTTALSPGCAPGAGEERIFSVAAGLGPFCVTLSNGGSNMVLSVRGRCPGAVVDETDCAVPSANGPAQVEVGLSGTEQFVLVDRAVVGGNGNFAIEVAEGACVVEAECLSFEDCPRGALCIEGACQPNAGGLCDEDAVRLINGPSAAAGRIEVCQHGVWGTVCNNAFDATEAAVVCRQLGYVGDAVPVVDGSFGAGPADLPIWLSEVACVGTEPGLAACPGDRAGQNECDHAQDAGVVCTAGLGAVELCNDRDDDNDRSVDESPADVGLACPSPLPGRCAVGTTVCGTGVLSCSPGRPAPEVCNGIDDNCNGVTDEPPGCIP
jgi:hypothetical protein